MAVSALLCSPIPRLRCNLPSTSFDPPSLHALLLLLLLLSPVVLCLLAGGPAEPSPPLSVPSTSLLSLRLSANAKGSSSSHFVLICFSGEILPIRFSVVNAGQRTIFCCCEFQNLLKRRNSFSL
jgi:hypothetical protein